MNSTAANNDTVLNVSIARKSFGRESPVVIGGLEFAVKPAEIVSIIGPSGAGKSTLLSMIAGLDTEFDGQISRDRKILKQSDAAFTDVAFVFQEPRLMPWLTARENIALVLQQEDPQRVERLLTSVGLAEYADYYPGQLSGGMQRRLSLIRAFIVDPELLLLDEPFVSLDAPTADQLRDQLLALWTETQPAVLFVTHHLDEALAVADRILFLSTGPARVIHEVMIDIARPRRVGDPAVVELRSEILREYPRLLEGRTDAG